MLVGVRLLLALSLTEAVDVTLGVIDIVGVPVFDIVTLIELVGVLVTETDPDAEKLTEPEMDTVPLAVMVAVSLAVPVLETVFELLMVAVGVGVVLIVVVLDGVLETLVVREGLSDKEVLEVTEGTI